MKKETPVAHIEKRYQDLIVFLRSKPGVRAIFVHGSIARGAVDAWSDIDVLVITLRRTNFIRYTDGLLDMEVDSVCLDHINERLHSEPTTWYAWRELHPVFDPEHLGPKISLMVTNFARQYRTPHRLLADTYIRLRHLRQKCARGNEDRVIRTALAFTTVLELITAEFATRRRIPPPAMIAVPVYLKQSFVTPTMKRQIRGALSSAATTQTLVGSIDVLVKKLAPVMRHFPQYFRPWKRR